MTLSRQEYNDDRDSENIEFVVPDTDVDVTIYIIGTGTEDDVTKYINKGSLGTGFVVRPSSTILIKRINNKTFRNPITVSTAGFEWTKKIADIHRLVLRTTAANTLIRLLVL